MPTVLKLSIVEIKLYLREPLGVFFAVLFPAVLLVVLGSAIPAFRDPSADIGGRVPIEFFFPIALALAIATAMLVPLLNTLALYRERGVLRRLATTPASPAALLGAQVAVNLLALLAGCLLAWLAGRLAFGIPLPGNPAGFALALVLGAAAMGALALCLAAVAKSARAAAGIGQVVYFPMLFFAGVWTPGPLMPAAVRRVADFVPLGAASQALQDTWAGGWPRPLHLAVAAASVALFGGLAVRFFRWT
ncbi:ABC transporter permease [Rhizomonospora bruguierae]|uniref:ABC transporter permease n=1 Tax=Rhizomonospora bruguierae TaxID=1581705 RepID=UPI001BCCF313|nr:ABC transporter permease [Micromonospora sp. NBRC 107566]